MRIVFFAPARGRASRQPGRGASRGKLNALLIAALLGAPALPAFAERADKDKPAHIDAYKVAGDDLNQTQVYTGDVVLTKGTIVLRADQLTTRQDPEGYNFGVAIVTQPGKLAYFKQKREGVDEFIEGQAERIEYDEKSDTIRLFRRGVVKRLASGRDADEIRGERIDYNSRTEVYNAQSGGDGTAAANGRNDRVRVVIQPKIKPGAPDAAAPPLDLKTAPALGTKPQQ